MTITENEMLHPSAVAKTAALVFDFEAGEKPPNHSNGAQFENIVAKSAAMQGVFDIMQKAAKTDASVLIFGESGAGKELVARGIHNLSRRKKKAFIPVDCVALPANLIESELFGFEKGSFTGAVGRKHGLFEFADQGTFFFDEICELDLMLQAKLLRVLQERQFRRVGGQNLLHVDMRVISATNRDPKTAVKEKVLREDLYFRLNVIPIYVPALRERKEDIPLLSAHFIAKFAEANNLGPKELAPETIQVLQEYEWPGNVRELQNTMQRVVLLCPRRMILPEDLPADVKKLRPTVPSGGISSPRLDAASSWHEDLENFKRLYFKKLLEQTQGDFCAAARQAKVSLRTLYRIIQSCKLL